MVKSLGSLLHQLDVLETRGDLETGVKGIAYDSRKVGAGDLFVAVRGTRQDGGAFVRDAILRGASVIVTDSALDNGVQVPVIRVSDSRKALSRVAVNFFDNPSRDLHLIGVTGTNGKTTTTLLLEGILKQAGCSVGVLGTLGYRWADKRISAPMTTPESLDL